MTNCGASLPADIIGTGADIAANCHGHVHSHGISTSISAAMPAAAVAAAAIAVVVSAAEPWWHPRPSAAKSTAMSAVRSCSDDDDSAVQVLI